MKLKDMTSKDWLDEWLIVVTIFCVMFSLSGIFFGSWWGVAYSGFLIGLILRIKYIKTEFFGPIEILLSCIFWAIWDTIVLLLFIVPGILIIECIYHPNPEAIPIMILYLGNIMCPILAGLLRRKFGRP